MPGHPSRRDFDPSRRQYRWASPTGSMVIGWSPFHHDYDLPPLPPEMPGWIDTELNMPAQCALNVDEMYDRGIWTWAWT